jgi:hypothetical protein
LASLGFQRQQDQKPALEIQPPKVKTLKPRTVRSK